MSVRPLRRPLSSSLLEESKRRVFLRVCDTAPVTRISEARYSGLLWGLAGGLQADLTPTPVRWPGAGPVRAAEQWGAGQASGRRCGSWGALHGCGLHTPPPTPPPALTRPSPHLHTPVAGAATPSTLGDCLQCLDVLGPGWLVVQEGHWASRGVKGVRTPRLT